jgi:hypothetical protein
MWSKRIKRVIKKNRNEVRELLLQNILRGRPVSREHARLIAELAEKEAVRVSK